MLIIVSLPTNLFLAYLAQKLEQGGSETTIYLDRITSLTGETLTTSDLADFARGVITVNPDADGDSAYPEFISFTAVDSSALSLTGATRGLSSKSNSVVTDNKRFHPVGTPVVISFGVHQFQDLIDYTDAQIAALTLGSNVVNVATCGENVSAGELLYLKNDGKWWKCDADTVATIDNVQLGIAQGAGVADAAITNGVLTKGLDTNQSGLVAGTEYFASNTAGAIASSAGTNSKKVGVARSTTNLYFDPYYGELPSGQQKIYLNAVTGMIVMYGRATPPTGFLLCNGQAVSRTTYADLFAVLGTSYGVGDGSTTFNVPDLRSSFPVGYGQKTKAFTFVDANVATGTDIITVPSNKFLYTGQAVALTTSGTLPTGLSATTYYVIYVSDTTIKLATSRANADDGTAVDITAAAGGGTHTLTLTLTSRAMGDEGGEESHTIQTEEMASHTHSLSVAPDNAAGAGGGGASTSGGTSGATGGDTPHNNMPPFVTVSYIIKT